MLDFFFNRSQVMSRSGKRSESRVSSISASESIVNYKLTTNHSEHFYIMLVHNGVLDLTNACQGQGQVRSTMATMRKRKRVTHLVSTIFDLYFNDEHHAIL